MELEIRFTTIIVNLASSRSGSAQLVFEDANTKVVYGDLHARVIFSDIGFEVKMDPYEGDWDNPEWARKQAWNAMRKNLTVEAFTKVIAAARECGRGTGDKEAREEIRTVLGIQPPRGCHCSCGPLA